MIGASTDPGFSARLIAKAKRLAEARAEARAQASTAGRDDPDRWRRAKLLWPLFAKG